MFKLIIFSSALVLGTLCVTPVYAQTSSHPEQTRNTSAPDSNRSTLSILLECSRGFIQRISQPGYGVQY